MTKSYHSIWKNKDPKEAALQWLFEYLKDMVTLTEEEKKAMRSYINIEVQPKGRFLLREGEYSQRCYLVLKGCVRKFYVVDGIEKTTAFYTEGHPINPMISQRNPQASTFYLECLEDTIMSAGTAETEAAFFKRFPRFEAVCRVQTEGMLGELEETLAQYMISTPEQRYLKLMESRPELLARVPQYQLASYVGVKPESLSRIRKRILQR